MNSDGAGKVREILIGECTSGPNSSRRPTDQIVPRDRLADQLRADIAKHGSKFAFHVGAEPKDRQ